MVEKTTTDTPSLNSLSHAEIVAHAQRLYPGVPVEEAVDLLHYWHGKSINADFDLVSNGLRYETIAKVLSETELQRLGSMEFRFNDFCTKLQRRSEINRLYHLMQMGGKVITTDQISGPETARSRPYRIAQPTIHSRHEHAELDAYLAFVGGVKAGFSDEEIMTSVAGAWLHDIAHAAFSHIGDNVLISRGYPDHEKRGCELIIKEFNQLLKSVSIDPAAVTAVVREEGVLGSLQSALDTLSYLILDTSGMNKPRYPNYGTRVVQSICGMNRETKHLQVNDLEPWQELLENRAAFYYEGTYHPRNRLVESAKEKLLLIAIDRGVVTAEDLLSGVDHDVTAILQSNVQPDYGAAKLSGQMGLGRMQLADCKDLWSFAVGAEPDRVWRKLTFNTLEEAEAHPLYVKNHDAFIVPKTDYTKKQLRVELVVGDQVSVHTLTAHNTEVRDDDKKYVMRYPARLADA